jgi:hypothetical protein
MSLKCITGEDAGMEARFTTTSVGGKRAVQELAVAIATQVDKDQATPVPVVTLGNEHYQHKSYGRIYTPAFGVKEWVSLTPELLHQQQRRRQQQWRLRPPQAVVVGQQRKRERGRWSAPVF